MRMLVLIGVLLGLSASASAQSLDVPRECWPVAAKGQVVVTRMDGTQEKSTLLCMGPETILLAGTGTLPLSSIREISKPADGVIDGILKGASFGLIILAFCSGECSAETVIRGTLSYATIGGVVDAMHDNRQTIYRQRPAPSLAWKIRF